MPPTLSQHSVFTRDEYKIFQKADAFLWDVRVRLFGHTGLFLLALTAAALLLRRPLARALAIGVATHLALDIVGQTMDKVTLFWPLLGWRFTPFMHRGLGEHLWTVLNPVTLAGELVGGAIIVWDLWRKRHPPRGA